MPKRIEVFVDETKTSDARKQLMLEKLHSAGFNSVQEVKQISDVYTIEPKISGDELRQVSSMLSNSVFQIPLLKRWEISENFDYAVEVGFKPCVTDNIGTTAREGIEDLLGKKIDGQGVASSQLLLLSGDLDREEAEKIGGYLANPVIERFHVKDNIQFKRDMGMDVVFPEVRLDSEPKADLVEIVGMGDEELEILGKQGIVNPDGTKRGPPALRLEYMKTMQQYFQREGRNPFDVEFEAIAQTWSEHCKHTIFADPLDNIEDGLYKTYIKGATAEIRRRKQKEGKDFCVSVFSDNAGIIEFDENNNICLKVETHNSPSSLDPFGGSITGIVGVNRDPMGTGLGSKPFLNISGPFCFANPNDDSPLYKGENFTQKMLSSRQILDGVVEGVRVGGNCSGIPTTHFRMLFDERFRGKPLVYVGTLGVMPVESAGKLSHEKAALCGDYIVMAGGRVGKDGIHGATFSSEAMDSGSPMGAVQIGDPITQKKMSDALVKEARDLGLYNSITDNGAGGLSCSVAEMAKESGGFQVQLDKVPLKYPGLAPWETWVSESQERMTLSVPKSKWPEFYELMEKRGVEATIIGEFTNTERAVVDYNGDRVMDIDLEFLHNGLPKIHRKSKEKKIPRKRVYVEKPENLTKTFLSMLARPNIASLEFIANQYDHEVQGGSALKPLQGKGRVNGDATIIRPILSSRKGVVLSQGINPSYSEIDAYHMAACAIDTAIRNAVCVGASLEKIALLDNFCWCSGDEPERLHQLKDAVKACYDYSVAFETPFVSGKDSMFNDFKGFNKDGNPVKISIPPTLLVTAVGVMDDIGKAVSLDAKCSGDLVYVLGGIGQGLGGSEYSAMQRVKEIGLDVPKVNSLENKHLYENLSRAIDEEFIASAQSVHIGGLGVALAKTAMGGDLGMDVSLNNVGGDHIRDDFKLYSESQGRVVVTVHPRYKERFERLMEGEIIKQIGKVNAGERFVVRGTWGKELVRTDVASMSESYKSTFRDF